MLQLNRLRRPARTFENGISSDMMAALTLQQNTAINGAQQFQLSWPISTMLKVPELLPAIADPNGATVEDAAFNKAGYASNADRYALVWQFLGQIVLLAMDLF